MNIEVKTSRDKTGLTLTTSAGIIGIMLAAAANELFAQAQTDGIAGKLSALLLSDVQAAQAVVKAFGKVAPVVHADAAPVLFAETLEQLPTAEELAAIESAYTDNAQEEPGEGNPATTFSHAEEQAANRDAANGKKHGK